MSLNCLERIRRAARVVTAHITVKRRYARAVRAQQHDTDVSGHEQYVSQGFLHQYSPIKVSAVEHLPGQ